MNILFLRGFNNYFNRIVKKYSALSDYKSNASSYIDLANINFNPNDGVVTELIIGNENQKESNAPLNWENIGTPDYCICYESGTGGSTTIISRWFVLESERTRSGQYRLALKRDVVAEHFDAIMNAPCFVEKGIINDKSNPLLYNNESMSYNQIKAEEYLLKDSTESAWIIGYVAKNEPQSTFNISTTLLLEGDPDEYYDSTDLPFNVSNGITYAFDSSQMNIEVFYYGSAMDRNQFSGTYYNGKIFIYSYIINTSNNSITNNGSIVLETSATATSNNTSVAYSDIFPILYNAGVWYAPLMSGYKALSYISVYNSSQGQQSPKVYEYLYNNNILDSDPLKFSLLRTNNSVSSVISTLKSNAILACTTPFAGDGAIVSNLSSYNGKIVKYNGKYYTMNISIDAYNTGYFKMQDTGSSWNIKQSSKKINGYTQNGVNLNNSAYITTLRNNINSVMSTAFASSNTSNNTWQYATYNMLSNDKWADGVGISIPKYSITLEPISTETLSVQLPTYSDRNTTYDSPADIFAIPYGQLTFEETLGGTQYWTSKTEGLAMARALATSFGSACYDLQLLPYCPSEIIRNWYSSDPGHLLNLQDLNSKAYKVINKTVGGSTVPCSFMLWVSSCKGTFDIPITVNLTDDNYSEALTAKLINEVSLCRLASPNFNGMFEFSLAKNDGLSSFNVDYTYKPYQPYIHINPDFKFIYGNDWNDARGLICGGDFSLAFINSYWQEYQNNNKNYQQIFDRQIQNMDVNNSIAMEKQKFQTITGAITGTITGGVGGAIAGASKGGIYGAIAGAVVGTGAGAATSIIGGQMDINWLQRQQEEARSYAIDMYGYQLENIQAMPYSLARTEALTNNNKIFPILELYLPTEIEINALINKLQYNGMTIMTVGQLKNFSTSDDFENVFVKGQLIKLDSLDDDFHVANSIYEEINKGIYITQGGNS